jgi:hypothetical protein
MRILAVASIGALLLACSSGETSSSSSSSGTSGTSVSSSGSSGTSSGTSGGGTSGGGTSGGGTSGGAPTDPKRAICEAYADGTVTCCVPAAPVCGADRRDGWVDFCMKGYDSCPKAYDCLAKATCATRDTCPNFGSGCQ